MSNYTFVVREIMTATVHIEADSEEAARALLWKRYEADEINADHLSDVEFESAGVTASGDPEEVRLARFEILGLPALITEQRARELTGVPGVDRLYAYDLRHGDDDSIPVTVERHVGVNRYATVFTAVPLLREGEEYRELTLDDWGYDSDLDDCTPVEFLSVAARGDAPEGRQISDGNE